MHLKFYFSAGKEIELFFPLYQYTVNLKKDLQENIVHIITNSSKQYIHTYGIENFTEEIKDKRINEIINYFLSDNNTLSFIETESVIIYKPTSLDRSTNDYINIIKKAIMPQLSEKANITKAGDIKEKTKLQRKREKIQLKNKKKLAIKKANEQPRVIKFKEITGNVCIKNITTNIIKRIPKPQAELLMIEAKDQFIYCSKAEWRLQKASKEPIIAKYKGEKELNRLAKLSSKTSLRPIDGIQNPKTQLIKITIPAHKETKIIKTNEVTYEPCLKDVHNWEHLKDTNQPRTILKNRFKKVVKPIETKIEVNVPAKIIYKVIRVSGGINELKIQNKLKNKYDNANVTYCDFTITSPKINKTIRKRCIKSNELKSPGAIIKKLQKKYETQDVSISNLKDVYTYSKPKKKLKEKKALIKGYKEYTFPKDNSFLSEKTIKTYVIKGREASKPYKYKQKKKWKCPIKVKSSQRRDLKKGVY